MFVYHGEGAMNATAFKEFVALAADGHGAKPLNSTHWARLLELYPPRTGAGADNRQVPP